MFLVRLVKFLVLSYLFPIGLKFGSTLFLNPSSQPGTSPLNEKLLIFEKLLVQRLVLQHLVQLFLVQHCLVQPVWCSVGNLGQKLKETVAGHLTSPCLDLTRQSSHSLSYCSVFFIEDFYASQFQLVKMKSTAGGFQGLPVFTLSTVQCSIVQ